MKTLDYLEKEFGSKDLPLQVSFFRMQDSDDVGAKILYKGIHSERKLPMLTSFYGAIGSPACTLAYKENISDYDNINNVDLMVKEVIGTIISNYSEMHTFLSLKKEGKYLFTDADDYANFKLENWELL